MRAISDDVLDRLNTAVIEGNVVKLTCGKLARNDYDATNKVLEALGGKWNRKFGGHVYDGDAEDILSAAIMTGSYSCVKQDFGFFETPPEVVSRLMNIAEIRPCMMILEPSAGRGAIADAARERGGRVNVCEVLPSNTDALRAKSYLFIGNDFLDVCPNPIYDRVVMNPPFAKRADIDHIAHAWQFVAPGGRLVSVASASVHFRTDQKATLFRGMVARHGRIEPLPLGSFKPSGTDVNTVIVVMDKQTA